MYAPVVNWSTVTLLLILSKALGWETRQVDLSNTFVQAELKEHVYITMPAMFGGLNNEGSNKLVMKFYQSLYGLSQAPLYWYNYLKKALEDESVGFKCSN